jgi:chaperonin GroES
MMHPVPMPGYLLIEEFAEKTVTATGIFLTSDPDASIYQGHGIVKEVAPITKFERNGDPIGSEFSIGDEIYYNNNSGSLLKLDGKEYLVIKEASVLAKMVKE